MVKNEGTAEAQNIELKVSTLGKQNLKNVPEIETSGAKIPKHGGGMQVSNTTG